MGIVNKKVIKSNKKSFEVRFGQVQEYKPTSINLISKIGVDAYILDVGGGDRKISIKNFVNLDVERHPGYVTIVADAHNLPFKDDAFDLILCEDVLEHLKKPWLAVNEFFRVLKNGGFIYVDTAFMQPLHRWPKHYFNMTKDGLRVLFEKFQEIGSGVQPYQMPSYTLVSVMARYIILLIPGLYRRGEKAEFHHVYNKEVKGLISFPYRLLLETLKIFDRIIKPEKAAEIAVGVCFIGKKINNSLSTKNVG